MKISILLPYKENFSPNYPGAVSIFVNSTNKESKFKKNIVVYGSTEFKEKLSKAESYLLKIRDIDPARNDWFFKHRNNFFVKRLMNFYWNLQ